jgi:hypothetical protein
MSGQEALANMSITDVKHWRVEHHLPQGEKISEYLFGCETGLTPKDTNLTIFTVTVTGDGKQAEKSFLSFNADMPNEEMRKFLKTLGHQNADCMVQHLVKTYKSTATSYAERAKRTGNYKIKYTKKTHEITFEDRKSLLLWFVQCGEKMFTWHLLPTKKIIYYCLYDNVHGPTYSYISRMIWEFPFEADKVSTFLNGITNGLPKYTLMQCGESIVYPNFNWVPRPFECWRGPIKARDELYANVFEILNFYTLINEISYPYHMPPEVVENIFSFVKNDINYIKNITQPIISRSEFGHGLTNYVPRFKIPISINNFITLAKATSPVIFYEKSENVIKYNYTHTRPTYVEQCIIANGKRLVIAFDYYHVAT